MDDFKMNSLWILFFEMKLSWAEEFIKKSSTKLYSLWEQSFTEKGMTDVLVKTYK